MLIKHNIVKESNVKIVRPNGIGTVNPYGMRLVPNGAFVVYMNTDSKGNPFIPVDICTPYGPMNVETKTYFFKDENVSKFIEEFSKEFCPVKKEHYSDQCSCAITRLPWKPEKKLPSDFDMIQGIRSNGDFKQIRDIVDKIISTANNEFEEEGHPELKIEEAPARQK